MSLSARVLLVPACLALACPGVALASDELAPGTAVPVEPEEKTGLKTGIPFFDDITVAGNLYYFQRKRTRKNLETGRYARNLDHATVNASADLDTGLIGGVAGFNFGVFGARDLYSNASPYHEMAFFPSSDPFRPNWDATRSRSGVSVYKGYLRLEPGPFRAKIGYFQSTEPNTLGNIWSLMPGTWRGAEVGATFGDLTLGFAVADAYKAP